MMAKSETGKLMLDNEFVYPEFCANFGFILDHQELILVLRKRIKKKQPYLHITNSMKGIFKKKKQHEGKTACLSI